MSNQAVIPKINIDALSPEDRTRAQTFCKIMAIGIARLQEEEARGAVQSQNDKKIKGHNKSPINLPA